MEYETSNSSENVYVVGLGASAGGLTALEEFFSAMPLDSNLAFVIVQHLSPDFKSMMDELLARKTTMPIYLAKDGLAVKANTIYLIPARHEMIIMNGRLYLNPVNSHELGHYFPINTFFESLAREQGDKAIAIILSGAGSDGTKGAKQISQAGGLVITQEEETARFTSMPVSARNAVQTVKSAAPSEIPQIIINHLKEQSKRQTHVDAQKLKRPINAFETILLLLQQKFRINFSHYKTPTLIRRIERRMGLTRIESPDEYISLLKKDDNEINQLYRDMLLDVTHFFRDKEAFDWLNTHVVEKLVENAEENATLRIWVAACASGEEAYSIAILFKEEIEKQGKNVKYKIFATDAHSESIERAGRGEYSPERIKSVPVEFRQKYFNLANEEYKVDRTIRNTIVFAQQDLLKDAVFTNLDLVSCRNVLIYLVPEIQKKILSLFHFGLKKDGYLFLGPSEHLGDLDADFETLNREWRIFQKASDRRLIGINQLRKVSSIDTPLVATRERVNYQEGWEKPLLDEYVPDSVLINRQHQILQIFGEGGQFLHFSPGKVNLGVSRLVKEPFVTAVRAALHQIKEDPITYKNIRFDQNNQETYYELTVKPIFGDKTETKKTLLYYLIEFNKAQNKGKNTQSKEKTSEDAPESYTKISALEHELAFTRESLQSTLEEVETTNEELQAANEELMAANEELQSTNEELQSVNEELYTVNTEYLIKNEELKR